MQPEIREVRAGDIKVDPDTQRELLPARVKKMADGWDEGLVGTLTVNVREDGTVICLDGQHRLAAALEANGSDYVFRCLAHIGLSRQEEARLFRKLNSERIAVSKHEMHRIGRTEEDPLVREIDDRVSKYGLSVGAKQSPEWNVLTALSQAQNVRKKYGIDVLDEALGVLYQSFGYTENAFNGDLIRAMGRMIADNRKRLDRDHLVEVLRTKQADHWVKTALARYGSTGGEGRILGLLNLITREYNKGRTGRQRVALPRKRRPRRAA